MKDYIIHNGKKYKKIDESVDKRVTVKEVRSWLKKLEEFRYRKVRNVDARRVTSFINSNLSETDLPTSLQKKWEHAKYSREKHLADKFIKEKISEKWNKLTQEGVEMKNIKLLGMVEDIAVRERDEQPINKFEVIEAVKNYQTIGRQLFKYNGIVEVAKALDGRGFELVSTGGTARKLTEAGLNVIGVSEVTDHPEIFDGRVKSLHPAIHGPLLARLENEADRVGLEELGL